MDGPDPKKMGQVWSVAYQRCKDALAHLREPDHE